MNEQEIAEHLRQYRRGIRLLAEMIERNMVTNNVTQNCNHTNKKRVNSTLIPREEIP
jgi:hypothetical protein